MKNVKRTFFEDGYLAPCYELEDGTILLPFIKAGFLTWVTREEGEKIKTKKCRINGGAFSVKKLKFD